MTPWHQTIMLMIEKPFNNNSWVFRAPDATILIVNEATEVEMCLIKQDDISLEFQIIFMRFKNPISKDNKC